MAAGTQKVLMHHGSHQKKLTNMEALKAESKNTAAINDSPNRTLQKFMGDRKIHFW